MDDNRSKAWHFFDPIRKTSERDIIKSISIRKELALKTPYASTPSNAPPRKPIGKQNGRKQRPRPNFPGYFPANCPGDFPAAGFPAKCPGEFTGKSDSASNFPGNFAGCGIPCGISREVGRGSRLPEKSPVGSVAPNFGSSPWKLSAVKSGISDRRRRSGGPKPQVLTRLDAIPASPLVGVGVSGTRERMVPLYRNSADCARRFFRN